MTTETTELTSDAPQGGEGTHAAGTTGAHGTNAPEGAAAPAAAPAGDGAVAPASPAGKGDKPPAKTSFQALQDAYKASRPDAEKARAEGGSEATPASEARGEPAKAGAEESDKTAAPEANALTERIPEEEWKVMPRKTRARIETFRAAIKERDTAIQQLTPKAQSTERLQQYLSQRGMTAQHANQALELYSAVLHDPERAMQALQPILEYVQGQVGEILPEDIKARVQSGEISEQAGKELAKARKASERASARETGRAQAQERQVAEERAAEDFRRNRDEVVNAVGTWEQGWKSSDPDYAKKQPHVQKRLLRVLEAEAKAGMFRNKEQAIQLAKDIRAEVEADMAALAPPPREIRSVTGGSSTPAAAPPKSSFEAVKRAYDEARSKAAA